MAPRKTGFKSQEEFKEFSDKFQQEHVMPFAFGIGIIYKSYDEEAKLIAVKWATVNIKENFGTASALMEYFDITMDVPDEIIYREISSDDAKDVIETYFYQFLKDKKHHENISALKAIYQKNSGGTSATACIMFYKNEEVLLKQDIQNIPDAHFRLAAISRLHYKPNTLCLEKLFNTLPVLAWNHADANTRPMTVKEWNNTWYHREITDTVIDKIPLLVWGAPIPEGVRIPNSHSARLGAYLSPGTTIMPYGFVNFNAGTLGKAMVEGTIAAGVTVDDGTDIGKGGGFLGTLSGGNTLKLFAGKNCLIGALAECGIPLGDNCIVAAGVAFTANTPVFDTIAGWERKAIELKEQPDLVFRRNSITGGLEVIPNKKVIALNEELHKNSSKL